MDRAVMDRRSVLALMAASTAAWITRDAEEVLQGGAFLAKLERRIRARAKRWGIEVDAVGLADRTRAETVRLLGGAS